MTGFFKAVSMTIGVAAMLGSATLQAAPTRSETIQIPFEFKVDKTQLPAGAYRLMTSYGEPFARLVNVESGKQVQLLRRQGNDGSKIKTKLVFERDTKGYTLKKLS